MSPRASVHLNDGYRQLLRELNAERASALNRIARKLESLLAQLVASHERISHAEGDGRAREIVAYRDLRALAVRYRWYLEVQREALGLRQHDLLDEFYAIPGPIEHTS